MKEQGSAALRIVAFAVALAVVLGLASVIFSFTASAETADETVSQLGTLGNYDCIKFNYNSAVSVRTVVNKFNSYGTGKYVYGAVFGYKDGSFVQYTNNSINYCVGENSITFNHTVFFPSWLDKDTYSNSEFIFTESSSGKACSTYRYSTDDGYKYGSMTACAGNLSLSEFINTYGDTFYAVFTSSSTGWTTQQLNAFKSDVINNCKDSNFKDSNSDSSKPSAEFLSFKGTESSGLYLIDWVQAGQQYPIVDFRIDDKGNHHKYALRISGNSNYAEILKGIWDRQEVKESISAASNGIGILLLLKAAAGIGTNFAVTIAGASTPIGALFLNAPMHDVSGYVMLAAQNKLVKEYDTLTYDDIRTLTSDNMNFTDGSSTVSKAVSLCLSDYVSVVPNTLYKLEIIDVTDSKLLDVAYFSSRRGYQKSDSGYGTNITDYDNSGNLDNDIDNNNGYTGGSSSNGGKLDTDNSNDIINTDYNNSLANINISDIIVSLRTSIASVGVFFQSCWALFPPAIWSIILLGLSLIVVLRLLGR